jgi:hypothetical protein
LFYAYQQHHQWCRDESALEPKVVNYSRLIELGENEMRKGVLEWGPQGALDPTTPSLIQIAEKHEDNYRRQPKKICIEVEDDVKNDDDNVCNDLTSQLVVLHERGED